MSFHIKKIILIAFLIYPLNFFATEKSNNNQIIENNNNNLLIDHNVKNTAPTPQNTTINLMWFSTGKEKADSIFPTTSGRGTFTRGDTTILLEKILDAWAEKNPGVAINLWYDSNLLTETAVQNTQELIKSRCKHHDQIHLKDIRDLNYVRSFPRAFDTNVLLYLRLDLLRMIAGYEEINKTEDPSNFVYTDFSVEPMSWNDLMDEQTKALLDKFGFVMARGVHGSGDYENFFFIMSNQNKMMNETIHTTFIEFGIYYISLGMKATKHVKLDQQSIFALYKKLLFPVFYALKGAEYGKIFNKKTNAPYPDSFPTSKNFSELDENLKDWFNPFKTSGWEPEVKVELTDKAMETKIIFEDNMEFRYQSLFIPTKPYPNGGKWPVSHFTISKSTKN